MCIRINHCRWCTIKTAAYIVDISSIIYGFIKSAYYTCLLASYDGKIALIHIAKNIQTAKAVFVAELIIYLIFFFSSIHMVYGIYFKNYEMLKPWLTYTPLFIIVNCIQAVYLWIDGYIFLGIIALFDSIFAGCGYVTIYSYYKILQEKIFPDKSHEPEKKTDEITEILEVQEPSQSPA